MNGKLGASNNFAKGFFTEGFWIKIKVYLEFQRKILMFLGAEISQELMEIIRKVAEECDLVHGFQILHNVSGGTGGGLGSLLIDNIRQDYSDRMLSTYSIFPSLSMSQVVVG